MLISIEELSDIKMYQDAEKYTEKLYKEDAQEEDVFFFIYQKEGEENYEHE